MNDLKLGQRVKLKGRPEAGTVTGLDAGYVSVQYEPRPGTFTKGYYPVAQLEVVADETLSPLTPAEPVKPKARTSDVLGTQPVKA